MQGFQDGHALIVGIARYAKINALPQSVCNDAKDIFELLRHPQYCGYLPENTKLLLDEDATGNAIRENLHLLQQKSTADSTVIFYFSGHGGRKKITDQKMGNYLLPYDCDPQQFLQTAISGTELFDILEQIQAQRFMIVFDCCYAAGLDEKAFEFQKDSTLDKAGLDPLYYEELTQGTGRVIFASSLSNETSLVLPGMSNSLFTNYFLEAFRGQGHHRSDGLIRIFDVFDHVSEAVPRKGKQHPVFKTNNLQNNFPIALFHGGQKGLPAHIMETSLNKTRMREEISSSFSIDELKNLCQDIQQCFVDEGIKVRVDLADIEGNNRLAKVRELIEYLDRRQLLSYLASAVRRARPGIF
jgi:hypothetical protein